MNTNSSVGGKPNINVDVGERILSFAAGTFLLFNSLRKGKFGLLRLAMSGYLMYRGYTGNCALYSALNKPRLIDPVKNINVRMGFEVNIPRHELYAFWRKLENLPLFMQHLESVTQIDDKISHWVARIPGGLGKVSWDAEIVEEHEGSFIGWNSLQGSMIENAGKVEFIDRGNNWTEIYVVMTYRAPLGPIGQSVAYILNPAFEKIIYNDIKNFKFFIEKGIASKEGNLVGRKISFG